MQTLLRYRESRFDYFEADEIGATLSYAVTTTPSGRLTGSQNIQVTLNDGQG